jgi:hypothetical protein
LALGQLETLGNIVGVFEFDFGDDLQADAAGRTRKVLDAASRFKDERAFRGYAGGVFGQLDRALSILDSGFERSESGAQASALPAASGAAGLWWVPWSAGNAIGKARLREAKKRPFARHGR